MNEKNIFIISEEDEDINESEQRLLEYSCRPTRSSRRKISRSVLEYVEIRYNIYENEIFRLCINYYREKEPNHSNDFTFHITRRMIDDDYYSAFGVKCRTTVSCISRKALLLYLYKMITISNDVYETESIIHFGRNIDFFVLFDTRSNQRNFPDFLKCNPFCDSNLRANSYLHELHVVPSKNIEFITRNIADQLISANTCNFRTSIWRMNRFFDKYQMIRAEYFCTTILQSYIHSENSFKFLDCILNVVPFLFFFPLNLMKEFKKCLISLN